MASNIEPAESGISPSVLVQCVTCGDSERSQKLLLCLHPSCEKCLTEADDGKVTCKQCSIVTDVTHFKLNSNFLQATLRQQVKLTEPQPCVMCKAEERTTVGTHICFECDSSQLCEGCVKKHRVLPVLKSHKPVALASLAGYGETSHFLRGSTANEPCPKHHKTSAPQLLSFYCKACNIPACQMCVTIHHGKGEHEIISMEDKALEARDGITLAALPLLENKNNISERIQDARTKLNRLEFDKEHLLNDLHERMASLRRTMNEALDRLKTDYVTKIDEYFTQQHAAVSQELDKLQQLLTQIEYPLMFSDVFKDSCPDAEINEHGLFVTEQLQQHCTRAKAVTISKTEGFISLNKPEKTLEDDFIHCLIGKISTGPPLQVIDKMMNRFESEGQKVKLDRFWGVKSKSLSAIWGIDFTKSEDIVLSGNSINSPSVLEVYTVDGKQLSDIQHDVSHAWQIKVDDDDVYITDTNNGCVKKINLRGAKTQIIKPSEPFSGAIGVEVTKDSVLTCSEHRERTSIYWCKKGSDTATKLSPSDIHLSQPINLSLTPAGDIVACCFGSHSLSVFSPDGKMKFSYGKYGSQDGQLNRPYATCTDTSGRIYVADSANNRISVISQQGRFLCHLITKASHGISCPVSVKISPRGDVVAVAESNNTLTVFKISK